MKTYYIEIRQAGGNHGLVLKDGKPHTFASEEEARAWAKIHVTGRLTVWWRALTHKKAAHYYDLEDPC